MASGEAEEIKVRVLTAPKTKAPTKEPATRNEKKVADKVKKGSQKPKVWRRVVLLFAKVAFFVLICYVVFFVVFGVTRMNDYSMHPAVHDGDLLIYYRMENNYGNGDVAVVEINGEEYVMRIIASPGQELDISEKKGLLIDGQPSAFQAFYETHRAEQQMFKYPYRVSENCYFMINDYRSNTNDSRTFGEVCRDKIKGRLITKIQVRDL